MTSVLTRQTLYKHLGHSCQITLVNAYFLLIPNIVTFVLSLAYFRNEEQQWRALYQGYNYKLGVCIWLSIDCVPSYQFLHLIKTLITREKFYHMFYY